MCNPAAAVMGLNVAGGAYAYESQRQAGESERNYYNYLAAANEVQAQGIQRTAKAQVNIVQDAAASEARSTRQLARRFAGAQKAAMAANGVPLSSVSAEDVARDTMTKEELDQAAIRFNADSKAWETITAANQTAKNLREQGIQFRYAGENAKRAADIGATTSLLSSATNVADSWYRWNKTSVGLSQKKQPGSYRYAGDQSFVG